MNKITKDIEALREAIRYCSIAKEMYGNEFQGAKFKLMKVATPELIDSVIEQFEAECQRAENASFRENHLNEMLNDKIQQNVDLRAELAALKGEQVPYAFSYRYAGCETCEGFQDWRNELSREMPASWMVETGKVIDLTELFTAPQKPVISKEKLCDWLEDNFDINDSQRDALADCFAHHCNCIVKGGE